jgi:hypothetical protein
VQKGTLGCERIFQHGAPLFHNTPLMAKHVIELNNLLAFNSDIIAPVFA